MARSPLDKRRKIEMDIGSSGPSVHALQEMDIDTSDSGVRPDSTCALVDEPLEVVPNDLDDETHNILDIEVFQTTGCEPSAIDLTHWIVATGVLATIVSTAAKMTDKLNREYGATQNAAVLLKEQPQLIDELKAALAVRTFRKIRNLKILRVYHSPSQVFHLDSWTLDKTSHELEYFKQAFEMDYTGQFPGILLTTMDLYAPGKPRARQYYNRSFSIVQSSGMGKSRLADHSAKSRFAFPFNIHEPLTPGNHTYPPFDDNVRKYLTIAFEDELPALTRHFAFLEALFTAAVDELKSYNAGSSADIAQQWYEWMNYGVTPTTVGTNRVKFYNRVIEAAIKLENMSSANLGIVNDTPASSDLFEIRRERLVTAARAFFNRLRQLHGPTGDKFVAFVYFDEAHALHNGGKINSPSRGRNPYFALMHVLSKLNSSPIFFIFLSTDSSLNAFAPTDAEYPSLRVPKGWKLIPPFFELPFHSFCYDFTKTLRQRGMLTLNGVCELEQMVKIGRPMWYSHYTSIPHVAYTSHPTIELAIMKLGGTHFATDSEAQLACLDSRVLLQYHPTRTNSRDKQDVLIKTKMRIVFNVPEDRHFTWSGYASEPILAEAAARLLNESGDFIKKAPQILGAAVRSGFLACGERGEAVVRTICTVAHDLAVINHYPGSAAEPRYHKPIRLLHFLKNLVSPAIWSIVRTAKPFHCYPDDKTLEAALSNAWVNFSHFVQLGDHDSFTLHGLSELLKSGAAAQTWDNQYNMDIGLPILIGDPATTIIAEMNTTLLQLQIKNTPTAVAVYPDPEVAGSSEQNLPVISVTMQLGVKEVKKGVRVHIESTPKEIDAPAGSTRSTGTSLPADINRRHYVITLYGCTAETYSCVPANSDIYSECLRAEKPFIDFPRQDHSDNVNSVEALQSRFYDNKSIYCTPWS